MHVMFSQDALTVRVSKDTKVLKCCSPHTHSLTQYQRLLKMKCDLFLEGVAGANGTWWNSVTSVHFLQGVREWWATLDFHFLWWLLKGSDAGKRRSRTGEESGKGGSRATYGNRQEGQREVIKLEERNSVWQAEESRGERESARESEQERESRRERAQTQHIKNEEP